MKIYLASFITFLYNDIITHIPLHFVRKGFLRMVNKKISQSSVILMHVRILGIWNLEIGERSIINQYCLLDCRKFKIKIENDVDIGPYTKVWTLGHKPDNDDHELYGGDTTIEHHVWIASGVTILPNVNIKKGAVIASGSVVSRNVEPLMILGGNPAKIIRKRTNSLNYKLKYNPVLE